MNFYSNLKKFKIEIKEVQPVLHCKTVEVVKTMPFRS